MSPTLLEIAVAIMLIVVAWQLGLALAPLVRRELHTMRQSFDEASEDSLADLEPPPVGSEPTRKDRPNES
jgi:hypothetical protein